MTTIVTAIVFALFLQNPSVPEARYPEPKDMQVVHIALLLKGPKAGQPMPAGEAEKLQAAHLAHLTKLGTNGQAFIAGPMGDDGDLRGIVVLNANSAAAAMALEADDPAVQAGRLKIEIVSFVKPGNWFSLGEIPKDYKMRQFIFGFLKAGPNLNAATATPAELQKLQQDHLANLWAMREAGALVMAGPVTQPGDKIGIICLAVNSIEEAKALLEKDPGVLTGRFVLELHPWYAADGIMKAPRTPAAD